MNRYKYMFIFIFSLIPLTLFAGWRRSSSAVEAVHYKAVWSNQGVAARMIETLEQRAGQVHELILVEGYEESQYVSDFEIANDLLRRAEKNPNAVFVFMGRGDQPQMNGPLRSLIDHPRDLFISGIRHFQGEFGYLLLNGPLPYQTFQQSSGVNFTIPIDQTGDSYARLSILLAAASRGWKTTLVVYEGGRYVANDLLSLPIYLQVGVPNTVPPTRVELLLGLAPQDQKAEPIHGASDLLATLQTYHLTEYFKAGGRIQPHVYPLRRNSFQDEVPLEEFHHPVGRDPVWKAQVALATKRSLGNIERDRLEALRDLERGLIHALERAQHDVGVMTFSVDERIHAQDGIQKIIDRMLDTQLSNGAELRRAVERGRVDELRTTREIR